MDKDKAQQIVEEADHEEGFVETFDSGFPNMELPTMDLDIGLGLNF